MFKDSSGMSVGDMFIVDVPEQRLSRRFVAWLNGHGRPVISKVFTVTNRYHSASGRLVRAEGALPDDWVSQDIKAV